MNQSLLLAKRVFKIQEAQVRGRWTCSRFKKIKRTPRPLQAVPIWLKRNKQIGTQPFSLFAKKESFGDQNQDGVTCNAGMIIATPFYGVAIHHAALALHSHVCEYNLRISAEERGGNARLRFLKSQTVAKIATQKTKKRNEIDAQLAKDLMSKK